MTAASDNVYPKLILVEGSAPSSPAATNFKLYFDSSDHLLKWKNSAGTVTTIATGAAGSVATDAIWDAAGDLVQGTGADTAAKLSAGTAGMTLKSAGAAAANLWAFPPGYEFSYVAYTASVTTTATTEGTAATVVTSGSVAYDGSTIVKVEFFTPRLTVASTAILDLYVDSTILGRLAVVAGAVSVPVIVSMRYTPSNASHTFTVKAWESGGSIDVNADTGGTAKMVNGYIQVTKV